MRCRRIADGTWPEVLVVDWIECRKSNVYFRHHSSLSERLLFDSPFVLFRVAFEIDNYRYHQLYSCRNRSVREVETLIV